MISLQSWFTDDYAPQKGLSGLPKTYPNHPDSGLIPWMKNDSPEPILKWASLWPAPLKMKLFRTSMGQVHAPKFLLQSSKNHYLFWQTLKAPNINRWWRPCCPGLFLKNKRWKFLITSHLRDKGGKKCWYKQRKSWSCLQMFCTFFAMREREKGLGITLADFLLSFYRETICVKTDMCKRGSALHITSGLPNFYKYFDIVYYIKLSVHSCIFFH